MDLLPDFSLQRYKYMWLIISPPAVVQMETSQAQLELTPRPEDAWQQELQALAAEDWNDLACFRFLDSKLQLQCTETACALKSFCWGLGCLVWRAFCSPEALVYLLRIQYFFNSHQRKGIYFMPLLLLLVHFIELKDTKGVLQIGVPCIRHDNNG